jgi:hypothetical protein
MAKHWVFIEKRKMSEDINATKIFGSIKEMLSQNIKINDKILNYGELRYRLVDTRYFQNDDYLIKECEVLRSKRKK